MEMEGTGIATIGVGDGEIWRSQRNNEGGGESWEEDFREGHVTAESVPVSWHPSTSTFPSRVVSTSVTDIHRYIYPASQFYILLDNSSY